MLIPDKLSGKIQGISSIRGVSGAPAGSKASPLQGFRAKFPARAEQGIVSGRSGNLTPDTGNLRVDQGNKDRASSTLRYSVLSLEALHSSRVGKGLGGKLGRLATLVDGFNDLRCNKGARFRA